MREAKKKAERIEEEKGEKRKREEVKEENETETVKRRCEGLVSVEAKEIFSEGERFGELWWVVVEGSLGQA